MDTSLETIDLHLDNGAPIQGTCAQSFRPVLEAFIANFQNTEEIGASVCLTHEGRTLVHLWGGFQDKSRQTPWAKDTLGVVFSATKGAVALCAHVLAARGQLDLDAPVADYWPEFSCNGKEDARISMMLDHSVGLPVLKKEIKRDGFYDWDYMCDLLARAEPWWQPGTKLGYHGSTFGWLVGELIRRISGKSLGTFFQEEIAMPLGIEFWIGLPEDKEPRLAKTIPNRPKVSGSEPMSLFLKTALNEQGSIPSLFSFNNGGASARTRAYRAAEIGSAGGITHAQGLAELYAPLANGGIAANGTKLVDADSLARMGRTAMASHLDATLMIPTRFSLGFQKSIDNRKTNINPLTDSCILGEQAFGHPGMGGHIGFADPEASLSFGYSMNNMGHGNLINPRGQALIDAAYRSLGYISNQSGAWKK